MIKLIVGAKGTGKTKQLVDMMNENLAKVSGNIVCIEKAMQDTRVISSKVRVIDIDEYRVDTYEKFFGFFGGVLAGNYDIEQVYIDGLLRTGSKNLDDLGALLEKMDAISEDKTVVVTVSAATEELPESVKKYL